jgi:predicted naringenin-chalcone synthase
MTESGTDAGRERSQIARIASIACASPPTVLHQSDAVALLNRRYGSALPHRTLAAMHKVFSHPSIRTRRFAVDFPEQPLDELPDDRAKRFTNWAVSLSKRASLAALAKAGITGESISAVVVNTCTGYICPGISTYLLERLGLSPSTRCYDLVGAGCGGAIPNLQLATELAESPQHEAVLSVSVEICSATFQMADDLGLIVSNALFADGAAAGIVWNRPEGIELIDSQSLMVPQFREDIRYVHKGGQLHNQLSLNLPETLGVEIPKAVAPLLSRHGLSACDIKHWAIHPGGDKVIAATKDALGLSEDQLRHTREILAEYGNVSSATVWFEMEKILREGVKPGDWIVILAAGAGLSIHAMLLRV